MKVEQISSSQACCLDACEVSIPFLQNFMSKSVGIRWRDVPVSGIACIQPDPVQP